MPSRYFRHVNGFPQSHYVEVTEDGRYFIHRKDGRIVEQKKEPGMPPAIDGCLYYVQEGLWKELSSTELWKWNPDLPKSEVEAW